MHVVEPEVRTLRPPQDQNLIIKEQLVVFKDVDWPVYSPTERSHPVSRLGAPVQRRVYHHGFNFFT